MLGNKLVQNIAALHHLFLAQNFAGQEMRKLPSQVVPTGVSQAVTVTWPQARWSCEGLAAWTWEGWWHCWPGYLRVACPCGRGSSCILVPWAAWIPHLVTGLPQSACVPGGSRSAHFADEKPRPRVSEATYNTSTLFCLKPSWACPGQSWGTQTPPLEAGV